MKVIDAQWTPYLNMLTILCECGLYWTQWANVSIVSCPNCGRRERYHGVDPDYEGSIWHAPEMKIELCQLTQVIKNVT